MALIVKSYGNGALGDVSTITSTVNSCAAVSAITENSITIDAAGKVTGTADFVVGAKILIHVSATTGSTTALKTYLGNWLVATVTAVNGNTFTLDENPTTIIPADSFAKYYVQVVAFAQYKNLTLSTGTTIVPTVYSEIYHRGGIAAVMCSDTLKFAGGHISLADRGIPTTNKALRPELKQEAANLDTENYSGLENYCADYCPLNVGDGAAFIFAKKLVGDENSRIGNVSTFGVQFYRGSTNSVTFNEDPPASVTKLRNDEGLYSYDVISDPARLSREMNIKNFGNGSLGDQSNLTTQLNNYATITAINGKQITIKDATTAGLAQIQQGALVMIHFNHKNSSNVEHSGRFILANVTDEYNGVLTLDTAPPNISITDYAAQVVAIPQFNNFTLSAKSNTATPKFDGSQGGILALAVKDTCTLLGTAELNVEQKGGGEAYGREGLAVIGNAQDCDKLPIGQGHGSILILAQNLTLKHTVTTNTYHYPAIGNDGTNAAAIVYRGGTNTFNGSGADSGEGTYKGGYGSSGADPSNSPAVNCQGAHAMIVADTITGLRLATLRTGGAKRAAGHGGGHYGSGTITYTGGYNGGGAYRKGYSQICGGSSGWCFIYCNNAVDQNTSYIVYRD